MRLTGVSGHQLMTVIAYYAMSNQKHLTQLDCASIQVIIERTSTYFYKSAAYFNVSHNFIAYFNVSYSSVAYFNVSVVRMYS